MATNRVLVERLRPQTQQEVVVRPVDTYIRPAPVQEGSLSQLATFVERLEPRFSRLMAAKMEEQKEEDKKRAREIAETTTKTYDDLVKSGKIGPEESPVFRYAFNETRGQVAGYTFIQEASEAYAKSGMDKATDASSFDDWYQGYYNEYVQNNQGVLGMDGAYGTFSTVANQARQNLLNSHLSSVKKNFKNAQATAYNNFVFGALDNADFSTPEGVASFQATLSGKQGDLASAGGPEYSYTTLNNSTVDAMVAYYESKGFDTRGLEKALSVAQGGTGPLGGTAYAREKLATARVEWAKERLAAEQREESWRTINENRTKDNVEQVFYSAFMQGEFNTDIIYDTLSPEMKQQMMQFYPQGMAELTEAAEAFKVNRMTEPMAPFLIAEIRQDLENTPPEQRVQKVTDYVKYNRITDTAVMNQMYSFASSSRDAAQRGFNTDATKDPIFKAFSIREFDQQADKYTGEKAIRKEYFMTSYLELFDQVDENGVRVWDTMSAARKNSLLNSLIKEVNESIGGTSEGNTDLTARPDNYLAPQLREDGTIMFINGSPVLRTQRLK